MRKNSLSCLVLLAAFLLAACGAGEQTTAETSAPLETLQSVPEGGIEDDTNRATPFPEKAEQEGETMNQSKKVRFLADGNEIIVELEKNPAADALYELLPMELTFEDFNSTEKIAYPPEALPTEGSPDNCDPEAGSLCYYIPWGNLCFFYQDFRQSSSLIPLGTVSSGLEHMEQLDTVASVTAEPVE